MAKSYFNDTFALYKKDENGQVPFINNKPDPRAKVTIEESQIAWQSDIEYKFKNIEESSLPSKYQNGKDSFKAVQWINMHDDGK